MTNLTDNQLETSADQARAREMSSLQDMLKRLREIDRRRLYSKRGFGSLHDYAIKRFKYSPDEAHRRICAMRLLKALPANEVKAVEAKIADCSLHLTHLTEAHSFFRKVEHSDSAKLEVLGRLENTTKSETKKILYNEEAKAQYSFEADKNLEAIVEALKGLHPHLSFDELMKKICLLAFAELDPVEKARRINAKEQRRGAKAGKRAGAEIVRNRASAEVPAKVTDRSRYISADVKRKVWLKAEGKCQNCASTFALEFDHIIPFAIGGATSAHNLRLLCRNCNQRKAIETFGIRKIENIIRL